VYAKNTNGPLWSAGDPVLVLEDTRTTTFHSRGGRPFTLFSKPIRNVTDIWSKTVAPNLGSSLLIQSWRSGNVQKMKSICPNNPGLDGRSTLEDVSKLSYEEERKVIAEFNSTQDHGKWAVSKNVRDGHFCIGDLNRVTSQMKRGGGVLCMHNERVATAFRRMVNKTDCDP
jgi:hypothetical protein